MATLSVIGSGDAFGSGGRLQTCFLLETSKRILIDCGPSVLPGLSRLGVDPNGIDMIVLTHLHGDHFGGIPFLLRRSQVGTPRTRPLSVIGPEGHRERILATTELLFPAPPGVAVSGFHIDYTALSPGIPIEHDGVRIECVAGVHTHGSNPHAVRVTTDGVSVVYTGDTEWVEGLVALAAGCDLLIAECYLLKPTRPNHLDLETLLANRSRLSSRRLVITHMDREVLEFDSSMMPERLHDGQQIELTT